jgi:hypothetical protein
VTVNNGGRSNNIISQSFTVTVTPVPPPTLDPILNVTVATNSGTQTITLTGISDGSPTSDRVVRVSASDSNRRLLAVPTVSYTSPATTALLTFTPGKISGVTTVTVTVSDGSTISGTVHRSFTITVIAPVITNAPAVVSQTKSNQASGSPSTTQPNVTVGTDVAATLTPLTSAAGSFVFNVTGVPGGQYVVQASTDLKNWTTVQTNVAPFTFQDTTQGSDRKFYRAYYSAPQTP